MSNKIVTIIVGLLIIGVLESTIILYALETYSSPEVDSLFQKSLILGAVVAFPLFTLTVLFNLVKENSNEGN